VGKRSKPGGSGADKTKFNLSVPQDRIGTALALTTKPDHRDSFYRHTHGLEHPHDRRRPLPVLALNQAALQALLKYRF